MSEQVFLFDIGNVLLDFDLPTLQKNIVAASKIDLPALQRDWNNAALIAVETGKIDPRRYYETFARDIGLSWKYEEWIEEWAGIYTINPVGYELFLALHRRGRRVSMLSNLAAYHTIAIEGKFPDFFTRGGPRVFSYEVGFRKPDIRIYQAACETLGTPPDRCLFLDDMPENVAGARALGIHAMQFAPETHDRVTQSLQPFILPG
jgi:putative hydrolase of the HAD superfamily